MSCICCRINSLRVIKGRVVPCRESIPPNRSKVLTFAASVKTLNRFVLIWYVDTSNKSEEIEIRVRGER